MKPSASFLLLACFALLTACAAPAAPAANNDQVSTIVASTLQALSAPANAGAPAATPISGVSISFPGINFTIPSGLAAGASEEPKAEAAPADDMPWWATYPAHMQYPLDGYILKDTFHKPKIYVYPIAEYTAMNEDVGARIEELKAYLAAGAPARPDRLPFLPTFNAGQMFTSNVNNINFQNGSGIRYLTQYGQAPMPVNNHEMFYTFQGITNDGKYYLSAVLPASAAFLVNFPSPEYPAPPDGVPFNWDDFMQNEAHIEAVKQKLNSAAPETFTPALASLDALIQSVKVTAP